MIIAFDEMGVKVEQHLEKRLGHNLDATIQTEIVVLKGIYKSLKDGMASREDFFDIAGQKNNNDAEADLEAILADKKNKVTKKE